MQNSESHEKIPNLKPTSNADRKIHIEKVNDLDHIRRNEDSWRDKKVSKFDYFNEDSTSY